MYNDDWRYDEYHSALRAVLMLVPGRWQPSSHPLSGPTNAEAQQYIIVHTGPQLPDIIVKAVVGRRPKPMLDDN